MRLLRDQVLRIGQLKAHSCRLRWRPQGMKLVQGIDKHPAAGVSEGQGAQAPEGVVRQVAPRAG